MPIESQLSVSEWAEDTFGPVKDPKTMYERMDKEYQELKDFLVANEPYGYGDPQCAEELADIQMTLWRYATVCGIDLRQAVDAKMEINRKRKWKLDGHGHGYHVDEDKEASK